MRALEYYKGGITPVQAAEGINAAIQNAKRLSEDAAFLLEADRHATALSLAVLSLEEQGKCSILRGLLVASSEREVADCWRRYRSHTDKNYLALLPDYVRRGAAQLNELAGLFARGTESARASFDTIKQLGFYTDCCGGGNWSKPAAVIDKSLAASVVKLASVLSDKEPVTVKELELWSLHMRGGATRQKLLGWSSAMVAAGLKPADFVDRMRKFTEGPGSAASVKGDLPIM